MVRPVLDEYHLIPVFLKKVLCMKTETIAAISTALSDSGIGIIRVSGEDSIELVNKIFVNSKYEKKLCDYKTHTIHYGYIVDYDSCNNSDDKEILKSHIIDEVMVSIMKSPNSFTTENTVEINCHGGVMMVKKILENVLKCGIRIAEPGEFTKRAFLNGRIDLSEAEAVMDIIHAKSNFALKNSVKQLKGSLSDKVKELREKVIYEIAYIEAALDDPEHYDLSEYPEELSEKIVSINGAIKKLINTFENGKIWSEGLNTVIVGRPNAGKSSLLNKILGVERAIVTDIPGTTRDTIQESVLYTGIQLNITDTAGIRNTDDVVEKIGVHKAEENVDDADLVLYVVDSSVPLNEDDERILRLVHEKKCIILLNKNDLQQVVNETDIFGLLNSHSLSSDNIHIISSSTITENGIDDFASILNDMFVNGNVKMNDEVIVTNLRHKESLVEASQSLDQVIQSIEMGMPEDFFSIDMMNAYICLGKIIGEEIEDDLVQEIFTKFCMGK